MSRSAQAIAPCDVRAVIMAWIAVRNPNTCNEKATKPNHSKLTMSIIAEGAGWRMRRAGYSYGYVATPMLRNFALHKQSWRPENSKGQTLSARFHQPLHPQSCTPRFFYESHDHATDKVLCRASAA